MVNKEAGYAECMCPIAITSNQGRQSQQRCWALSAEPEFIPVLDEDTAEGSGIEDLGLYTIQEDVNDGFLYDADRPDAILHSNDDPLQDHNSINYGSGDASDPQQMVSGRFGPAKFLAGSNSIIESARNKLRRLFSWEREAFDDMSDDEDSEEMNEDALPKPFHSSCNYTDEDVLDLPYLESNDVNLSFNRWPDNCFIRIRLESYYPFLLRLAADRLIRGIRENTNLRVGNVKAMPMRRKRWCLLSSPHVDKRSKDLFEIQQHVRFLDVFPPLKNKLEELSDQDTVESDATNNQRISKLRQASKDDSMKFKGVLMVPLPNFVSFDYWFEEVHKPVKNRSIEKVFRKRIWVSKYFLHHYEKREKAEIIDRLTSPELYPEVPLRWKRHPCDYFALQLGELRKMYNFVATRYAEDQARKRYNVPGPKYYDIDEVRFVPNDDDRRCGYDSSDDEDDDVAVAKQLAAMDDETMKSMHGM
ncbi:30S ribosomal protein S10 [Babesia sp. Xinjiang]|uniref:30S ribosomal protein S10 n=1 Tax=Babesia sp. Xinjiang TaxID=462227 RepID=UPI000A21516E|nr:30S ribosomal protein S10 [Babesia sp. Xinjiang]ORM40107.1 30S ribosomal protein S10 [Babesia sp. Xinjiang]